METNHIAMYNTTAEPVPFTQEDLLRLTSLISAGEGRNFLMLEVVFVNEVRILELNRSHLGHDYVTDILTFPYHEGDAAMEGTLYCCFSQIQRQALELGVKVETELLRVVIHGMLHLVGYDDGSRYQRSDMRSHEDKYIKIYQDH